MYKENDPAQVKHKPSVTNGKVLLFLNSQGKKGANFILRLTPQLSTCPALPHATLGGPWPLILVASSAAGKCLGEGFPELYDHMLLFEALVLHDCSKPSQHTVLIDRLAFSCCAC